MARFIKKIFLFLVPIFLALVFIEYMLSRIPNSYSFKKQIADKNIQNTEVLVLGGSHAYEGINPALFSKKGLNLSNSAQSLYYDEKILEEFLPKAQKLKIVLLDISYISIGYDFSKSDSWRAYFYDKYFDIPPDIVMPGDNFWKHTMIYTYGPKQVRDYIFKGFNVNFAKEVSPMGWHNDSNRPKLSQSLDTNARIVTKQQDAFINRKLAPHSIGSLSHIVALLKSKNIIPVLVFLPCTSYYWKYLNKNNYAFMDKQINEFCECNNLKYINYMIDSRFVDDDFYDSNHLNKQGASKISKILNEDIILKEYN
jgi:hypothetical protein